MKIGMGCALGALLMMTGVACERDESPSDMGTRNDPTRAEETRSAQTANQPTVADDTAAKGMHGTAIRQLTDARCAQEQRCGDIGNDKDYTSQTECMTKVQEEWREELSAYECPGGIVVKELDECLEEIRNQECGNPFDALGKVMACRSSDICKAT